MEHHGLISLVPTLVVILLAVITRRTIESLLAGAAVGFVILAPWDFVGSFAAASLKVMQDETIGWIILVCGLFGSLNALLIRTGGALAFSGIGVKSIKSRSGSVLVTWLLGLLIFIDDYLSALVISSSMKKVTDRFRVSREMLSYVVDSTAAPMCVLVPISTWAVYFAGLLDEYQTGGSGGGMAVYISGIPYMLYAWITLLLVPLAATGILPPFGPMKSAEKRARKTGQTVPSGSEGIDLKAGDVSPAGAESPRLANFAIPIGALIFFTWFFGIDILKGIIVTLGIFMVMIAAQRLLSLNQMFDGAMDGFLSMAVPLGTVVAAFILKEANDGLGLTAWVIENVQPMMTQRGLPLVTFLTMSFLAFATGSFWGIFAIVIPIVFPMATALGTPIPIVIGALISASAFGSHACFYGDSTVLSAQGSGCAAMSHALTQLPYALVSALLAAAGFYLIA